MSNGITQFTVRDMQGMAKAFVDSNMFGVKNVAEALSLLLIAQAEGLHPAQAMRDFHVIQGKPALKADAMMARFQHAGGVVQWEEMSDKRVAAYFSHPTASPKPVLIEWTDETVKQAQLSGNPMHKKYPRQMKRARVISEGVRTVFPAAISGFYTPEEVVDFKPGQEPPQEVVTPAEIIPPKQTTAEVVKEFGDGLDRPQTREVAPESQSEPKVDPDVDPNHKVPTSFKPKRKDVALKDLDREHAERALKLAHWQVDKTDEFGAQWREGSKNIPILEKLLATMPGPAPEQPESTPDAKPEPEATTDTPEPEPASVLTEKHKIFVRMLGKRLISMKVGDMSATDWQDAYDSNEAALADPGCPTDERAHRLGVRALLEDNRVSD